MEPYTFTDAYGGKWQIKPVGDDFKIYALRLVERGTYPVPDVTALVSELLRVVEERDAGLRRERGLEAVIARQSADMQADAKEDSDNRARIGALEAENARLREELFMKGARRLAEAGIGPVTRTHCPDGKPHRRSKYPDRERYCSRCGLDLGDAHLTDSSS